MRPWLHRLQHRLWRLFAPRRPLHRLAGLVQGYISRWETARWDLDWKLEGERPATELSTIVPLELVEAVDSGWIPASCAVMDLGSGRGQIAAWLAERGFQVLAADISSEATALARLHFRHLEERLEFRTMDVCTTPPEPGRFDCLRDRGCFHVIPDLLCPAYVTHVAGWAKPGARLILFSRAGCVGRVTELFEPYFEIIRTANSMYVRSAGTLPRKTAPGTAFWMIRRDSA